MILLPRLGVTGEQDVRRAVALEDGDRVVVGLGEELPWRRRDDVLDNSTRRYCLPLVLSRVREDSPARNVVAIVHWEVRAAYGLDVSESSVKAAWRIGAVQRFYYPMPKRAMASGMRSSCQVTP